MAEKVIDEIAGRRTPGPQAGVPGEGGCLPPTPPIIIMNDEEDNHPSSDSNGGYPARERACIPPTLEEAHAYAKEARLTFDVDEFWDYYEVCGWTVRGVPVGNWKALMRNWARRQNRWARAERERAKREAEERARMEERVDAREQRRLAHIDARVDEREKKRERRSGGGRKKADNNVEMSDEVREEVRRDFTF